MFNKNNGSLQGEEPNTSYFHTMQEDLAGPSKPKSPGEEDTKKNLSQEKPLSKENPFTTKNTESSDSPFLTEAAPAIKKETPSPEKKPVALPEPTKTPIPILKDEELKIEGAPKKASWVNKAIAAMTIIILGTFAAGGYLFWMTQENPSQNLSGETPLPEQEALVGEKIPDPVSINPELEKYSLENPNIISIDIESSTDQQIKELLTKKALEVAKIEIKKPVEFIITDKNNVPIAFPIFAVATKINLSQTILNNLEEKFSLYMYPSDSETRLGLAIKLKNKDVVLTKMLEQEKTLPQDLALLFLDTKPETTDNLIFKDGKYAELSVRYLNLNSKGTLSIDYTFNANQLLIGASKDALRAIVDKSTIVLTPEQGLNEQSDNSSAVVENSIPDEVSVSEESSQLNQ